MKPGLLGVRLVVAEDEPRDSQIGLRTSSPLIRDSPGLTSVIHNDALAERRPNYGTELPTAVGLRPAGYHEIL